MSLFSGIGGLDAAVAHVFGCRFVAHVEADKHCQRVLRRHWPDVPCFDDVRTVGVAQLGAADLICGGFPCTDISVAGKGAGLDGDASGLWFEYLRIVRECRPQIVVVENTPRLYRRWEWRREVELPLRSLGYRVEWQLCRASDAGAPHGRERCFLLAVQAGVVLPCPGVPSQPATAAHSWPTPAACMPNDTENVEAWDARRLELKAKHGNGNGVGTPLGIAVRQWPTPLAQDCRGDRGRGSTASGGGQRLAGAVWPTPRTEDGESSGMRWSRGVADTLTAATRASWPTPTSSDAVPGVSLTDAVRPDRVTERAAPAPTLPLDWPTPSARAFRSGKGHVEGVTHPGWRGTADLPEMLGGTLHPEWVEQLMGLPRGWTAAAGDALTVDMDLRDWPAPRDKTVGAASPQHPWEAPRLCAPRTVPQRTSRLRALGNAVVPQQAVLALRRLIEQHANEQPQRRLFA